jgi:hypothetical protein
VLVVCGVLLAGACSVLARRQLGVLQLTSVLVAGEMALHVVFAWAAAPARSCLAAPPGAHAHHRDAGGPVPCEAGLAAEAAGGPPALPSLTMVAAHVVASALLALVLAAGERALWNLWSAWLRPALLLLDTAGVVLPASSGGPVPAGRATPVPRGVVLRGQPQRGPPGGPARAPLDRHVRRVPTSAH